LNYEIDIHYDIYNILSEYDFVKVPELSFCYRQPVQYKNKNYLCGITMELLEPPKDFDEQVHCCLGYIQSDIDSSWGQKSSLPVSDTNPTRGFFASPETLEIIWKEEGSDMTVELLAYQMGVVIRALLDNDILPNDVEWI
jgi:hypothetical protein